MGGAGMNMTFVLLVTLLAGPVYALMVRTPMARASFNKRKGALPRVGRKRIPFRDMPSGLAIEFLSAAYRDHHPLNLFVSDMRSALTLMTISLPLSWTMRTSKVSLSLHCLI